MTPIGSLLQALYKGGENLLHILVSSALWDEKTAYMMEMVLRTACEAGANWGKNHPTLYLCPTTLPPCR